jgi:hypothetical protein
MITDDRGVGPALHQRPRHNPMAPVAGQPQRSPAVAVGVINDDLGAEVAVKQTHDLEVAFVAWLMVGAASSHPLTKTFRPVSQPSRRWGAERVYSDSMVPNEWPDSEPWARALPRSSRSSRARQEQPGGTCLCKLSVANLKSKLLIGSLTVERATHIHEEVRRKKPQGEGEWDYQWCVGWATTT